MYELSKTETETIATLVEEANINYSHLYDDLLDHLCTDAEELINRGKSFNEALQYINKSIGLNGLREIQEATIFYVKFNLIIMKKVLKWTAIMAIAVMSIGMFFKLQHWPGASMLVFLATIAIGLFFLPVALVSVLKEKKLKFFSKSSLPYILGFLALLSLAAALIFKFMHWPGTGIITVISSVFMFCIFFPIVFIKAAKSEQNRTIYLTLTMFSFAFFTVISMSGLTSRVRTMDMVWYVDIDKELNYYEEVMSVESLIYPTESSNYPDNYKTLQSSLNSVKSLIDEMQGYILNGKTDFNEFSRVAIPRTRIGDEFDGKIDKLKELIDDYKESALIISDNNEILKSMIGYKLNTDKIEYPVFGKRDWWHRHFYGPPKYSYINLHQILKNVYQVHYELLNQQTSNSAPEL